MKTTARASLAILGLTAALAFAAPALAQQRTGAGFYVGGSLGQSQQSDQCSGATAGISCDDKDSAWKIFGGYQFNQYFAAEVGYTNLGEATASSAAGSITDEATAFEVVAVGMVPVFDRFSIYAKAGLFRGEIERSATIATQTGTNSATDFTFGLGVRYDITNNFAVRAEWQRYTDVGEITDIDVLSIGALFKF